MDRKPMDSEAWMDREAWRLLIVCSVEDPDTARQCLILTPETAAEDLARAAHELDRRGIVLPPVASVILERWNEQRAQVLLETVPRLLNAGIPAAELNPTAKSMQDIFPALCYALERTERLRILVDISSRGNIVLAGLANEQDDDVASQWAYELPKSNREIARWEARTKINLSPQMRQMYLRAGGVRREWICPFFPRLEQMERERGSLYTEIYSQMLDDVSLTADVVDRMQHFVELGADGFGKTQGFFADDSRAGNECAIYEWDPRKIKFSKWADDFAGFIERKLVGHESWEDELADH